MCVHVCMYLLAVCVCVHACVYVCACCVCVCVCTHVCMCVHVVCVCGVCVVVNNLQVELLWVALRTV